MITQLSLHRFSLLQMLMETENKVLLLGLVPKKRVWHFCYELLFSFPFSFPFLFSLFFFLNDKHAELPKYSSIERDHLPLEDILIIWDDSLKNTAILRTRLSASHTDPFCALSILAQFIEQFNLTQMFADRNLTGDDKIPLTQCAWF